VRVHGAVEIGEGELQQVDRMKRTAGRRVEPDLGPVRSRRQQPGHDHRHGGNERCAHSRRRQRLDARAQARRRPRVREPIGQHESGKHIERQQRDLIPPDRDQSGEQPGRQTCTPR
jgi:hypothetical protein